MMLVKVVNIITGQMFCTVLLIMFIHNICVFSVYNLWEKKVKKDIFCINIKSSKGYEKTLKDYPYLLTQCATISWDLLKIHTHHNRKHTLVGLWHPIALFVDVL